MASIFRTPEIIASGQGSFSELGNICAPLGKRVFIVTGRGAMREQGFISRAEIMLGDLEIDCQVFDGVEPEPSVGTVDAARAAALDFCADVVVGIGGGSALDVGKSVAGLLKEPEPTASYVAGRELKGNGIAFVGVPSTFGTGSEVTPNAVLCDHAAGVKKSIRHPSMIARAVIVDSDLGRNAPQAVKAQSGMDALTQAIESLISMHATPITETLSFGAAALLLSGIEDFVFKNSAGEHAENCASASLMAGMALANARLGAVHGLAHPIGLKYRLPHGLVCGILLPHVLRFNRPEVEQQYALLSSLAGGDIAEHCLKLLAKLGMHTSLRFANIKEDDYEAIAEEAAWSGSSKANPRKVGKKELVEILKSACAGIG